MSKFINCTICNSNKTKIYTVLDLEYNIYECRHCKNAFTYPEPKVIDYEKNDFHGQFRFESAEQLPEQWKQALNKQLNLIQQTIRKGSNILEIGCGQGLFLDLLKKSGYNEFGVEPSKTAFLSALNKGLKVKNGYFPETKFENHDFELLIMSQVLEHIKNPIDFLKLISKEYKGKYLLLIQSNYKGLLPRFIKKNWYAWVPEEHYSHFTALGINVICSLADITLCKIEYSSLEHNNYWLSKFSNFIPPTGDQIHCLIKL